MYLKELTLRGFKSFASTTRFGFEPGITAIVGPNGSGKSNVVDALAWVMGEQGAKSLRGANMADVIFAGGTSRSALGRAQVELTIDNSDGRLPISYSEVTISRTMFRSGGSEYAINRQPVRLLDVQELLSDSGLGRQMHVIVGQGQLDKVLSASPADRRAFIDEAAGVAKHRRRKDRALRKLESMDANLVRVLDLTEDMSVRLKPLARQAKAASAAHGVRSAMAYASARVLGDDLSRASGKVEKERSTLERLRADAAVTGQNIAQLKADSQRLAEEQVAARILADQVGDRYRDFTEQRGRFVSIEELANERAAGASRTPVAISESSVDLARERAQEARAEAREAQATADKVQEAYVACTQARAQAEPALKDSQRELAERQEELRRQTVRYERSVRDLEAGQLALEAAVGQAASARERMFAAQSRQEEADSAVRTHLESDEGAAVESAQSQENIQYDSAAEAERAARTEQTNAQRAERACIEEHSRLRSRRETLESSLNSQTVQETKVGSADLADLVGERSTLEGHLHITRGWEEAINALLGPMLSALVVEGADSYRAASDTLASSTTAAGLGAGGLLEARGDTQDDEGEEARPDLAPETGGNLLSALSVVSVSPALNPVLRALLGESFVCADIQAAHAGLEYLQVGESARRTLVATRTGAVIGQGFTRLRGVPESSRLVLRADLEETTAQEEVARKALDAASALVEKSGTKLRDASKHRQETLNVLRSADALRAKVAQETARLKALAHAALVDVERVQHQVAQAENKVVVSEEHVSRLKAAVPGEAPAPAKEALVHHELAVERAQRSVQKTWEAENQARMDAHIAKEAATAAARNAHAFETQAQSLREDRARQVERESRARNAMSGFQTVAANAREGIERCTNAAQTALALRDSCRADLQRITDMLAVTSEDLRGLEEARAASSELLLQAEVAFASAAGALGALRDRALELTAEYGSLLNLRLPIPPGLKVYEQDDEGVDHEIQTELWDEAQEAADNLLGAYGPHLPWEPPTLTEEADVDPQTYVRDVARAQVEASSRALSRLGVVNPLAIEEYEAASARYNFLQEQIQDLNRSKADLLDLIKQVDAQVKQAFEDAFTDTAQKFESTFARLFPGGTGRLELDDPSNPLTTGVEIYARPSGKRVTRLSLLSGGERSLAALAYLIAIFEARPSPFYILDEIEAALDDLNLSRVLSLLEDLRKESQLLIITHQKRTMEFADALYGVTMKDGVTAVMSHRMAG